MNQLGPPLDCLKIWEGAAVASEQELFLPALNQISQLKKAVQRVGLLGELNINLKKLEPSLLVLLIQLGKYNDRRHQNKGVDLERLRG